VGRKEKEEIMAKKSSNKSGKFKKTAKEVMTKGKGIPSKGRSATTAIGKRGKKAIGRRTKWSS